MSTGVRTASAHLCQNGTSVRYFISEDIPPFRRVLLVESGSRYLIEHLLPGLYGNHPENERVDLITCFPGLPDGFDGSRGEVFRVTDYIGRAARKGFYSLLRSRRYDIIGIICSGEAIMTKWKWALAWQIPAKLFILNENGDYFWVDRGNLGTIRHFVLFRAGLAGPEGVKNIARLLVFPFTFTYLLLFAAYVHLRRKVRT
jgi:hypothetical protein